MSRGRRTPVRIAPAPSGSAARRSAAQAAARWPNTRDIADAIDAVPRSADEAALAAAARQIVCGSGGHPESTFLAQMGNVSGAGDRDALGEQWRRILERPHTIAPGRVAPINGTVLRTDASASVLAGQVADWAARGMAVQVRQVVYRVAGSPPSHVAKMRFTALVARTQVETPDGPATLEVWAHAKRTTDNPLTQQRALRALAKAEPGIAGLIDDALAREPERIDATWIPLLDGWDGPVASDLPRMGLEQAAGLAGCAHARATWRLSEGWEAAVLGCPACRRADLSFAPLHRLDPADPALPAEVAEQVRALASIEAWVPYRNRWQAIRPLLGEPPLPVSLADALAAESGVVLGAAGAQALEPASAPAPAYRAPSLREVLAGRRR